MPTNILGYTVFDGTVQQLTEEIVQHAISGGEPRYLSCLNPHSVCVARDTPEFQFALQGAGWLIPDGAGIELASRVIGHPITQLSGPELFDEMSRMGHGLRVYLIGGTEASLSEVKQLLSARGNNVVGTYSPEFKEGFDRKDARSFGLAIDSSEAQLVWIGLGSPKQDVLMSFLVEYTSTPFLGGVGAAFDFATGKVVWPGKIIRKLRLIWLYRLFQQPRRLWTRTLVSGPRFLALVAREWLMTKVMK